jgi:mRNA interferase MazF
MKRGQLYRVYKAPGSDPKAFRVFAVVSRQVLLDSRFSTAICAPVYSAYHGLSTQLPVGIDNGLKYECSIHCDELVSIPKRMLSDFIGTLSPAQMDKLDQALAIALDLEKVI